jgi:hypothetical protein
MRFTATKLLPHDKRSRWLQFSPLFNLVSEILWNDAIQLSDAL